MLFGTSGIRGLYGSLVDEKLAMKIANLFADKDVVVARDTRTTGETLAFAAISGILGKGRNAIYLGIAPTPTLALATEKYKCKGIMITASHNPSEYNGIKLYENGREITRKAEAEIERSYESIRAHFTEWNKIGKRQDDNSMLQQHADRIKNAVNAAAIAKTKPKVVVDCNGAGTVLTPMLLKQLGCEVIAINSQSSGFTRGSEPNAHNLKDLSIRVIEEKADLGIGHDGDADRAVVVDETGEVLALDVQLAIMIGHEIEKNKKQNAKTKIVSTVEASLCIREAVESMGGEITITPVGSLYVSELIEKENAIFGGEPCGEYVFPKSLHVPDGILTAVKFVEIFCEKGRISKLKAKFRPYQMLREKFSCDNSKKYAIVQEVAKKITIAGKRNEQDGLRIDEDDGWFLIRASGTEPYIRLTMEYKLSERLISRAEELRAIIAKFIS